ncbi:MAG: SRPBCC domain-containing protein [Chloroflexota bacterium]|nr:SRPBCC domain-containing protein [Chloroflexota bacterium]
MADGTCEVTVDIHATPERVWQAITDPTLTREYFYGTDILSDWKVGSRWTSESDGNVSLEGKILEIDPPRRLVQTFNVRDDDPAASDEESTVSWELTREADMTRVHLVHAGQGEATLAYTDGGWEYILDGMKDLLESE